MGAIERIFPTTEKVAFKRLGVEFDDNAANTLWLSMKAETPHAILNFSLPILRELRQALHTFKAVPLIRRPDGGIGPIHYAVLCSEHRSYFNLGGDLRHFRQCLRKRDSDSLRKYSMLCLDVMLEWTHCGSQHMTTIALVQGKAHGGGFETALGADYLVAEEHSVFGFPEIMFGLFPCSGGMELLARRVGVYQAERMLTNGKTYSAAELQELGIVDLVCAKGQGRQAVTEFIAHHAKRRDARQAVQRSRYRTAQLNASGMSASVDEWVRLAMGLSPEELRVMDLLILMQERASRTAA